MSELKDTQNERDDRQIAIDRVGVKSLKFPLMVKDKGGEDGAGKLDRAQLGEVGDEIQQEG